MTLILPYLCYIISHYTPKIYILLIGKHFTLIIIIIPHEHILATAWQPNMHHRYHWLGEERHCAQEIPHPSPRLYEDISGHKTTA